MSLLDAIEKRCGVCGAVFETNLSRLNQGRGRFCSKSCAAQMGVGVHARVARYMRDAAAQARFWLSVDKSGGPGACWPFIGDRFPKGYGRFRYQNKRWRANRLVYLFTKGVDPGEWMVLHSCDNPPCCNPAHLSLGGEAANTADRMSRGRQSKHRAKLTPDDVARIMAMDGSNRSIAKQFAVHASTIDRIKNGKTWPEIRAMISASPSIDEV